ncbi:MAG: hypothetical protein M1360_01450 [Candidatus Marsarchaeota archaeon]|jgi:hypothetical protein|nr:hypothetical protein [Candidatus Marsarchaeota archaeon]MCL5418587.1 hypothetical protein [Candidatus Marsarchaeota archaeon]
MASNATGTTGKADSEMEFMKQLDSDTLKLITAFGAGSVSKLAEKPKYRWLP